MESLSVNRLAWQLLEEVLQNRVSNGVKVSKTCEGSVIVDAGVKASGGFRAGIIITEICMGGLGKAWISTGRYGETELLSVSVFTDHPAIATLGSQFAGWRIDEEGCSAIGSGPARALAMKPKHLYEEIRYKDSFDKAIVILETQKLPPTELIGRLAKECGVKPKDFAAILAPTTSLTGAIQVSGRIVETGIHKLRRLGLDPRVIQCAWGIAPVPPVHPNFVEAMARMNDSIMYGGTSCYVVDFGDDEKLEERVRKAPSMASDAYGRPFIEIFKEAKCDFYKIDPDLFAPAVITVNNKRTGNVFRAGRINVEALTESFGSASL